MGYYINPSDKSKEQWLVENGFPVSLWDLKTTGFENLKASELPVCLIDNGWMTAAGICYDEAEFNEFSRNDGRPKRWFLVKKNLLTPWL